MYEDVYQKLKRKNKILFSRDSACLQPLLRLIEQQHHQTLILWAFDCTKEMVDVLSEKYPLEIRPKKAYLLAQKWASGEVKMREAKRVILDCHAVSKTLSNPSDIALCHAIGQGLSTVHVETHAIGLALYELSAIVLKDPEKFESEVEKRIQYYEERLIYFQNHRDERKRNWATFLLKDNVENKEKLLHEKRIIDK